MSVYSDKKTRVIDKVLHNDAPRRKSKLAAKLLMNDDDDDDDGDGSEEADTGTGRSNQSISDRDGSSANNSKVKRSITIQTQNIDDRFNQDLLEDVKVDAFF